jgi:hypothetical protein
LNDIGADRGQQPAGRKIGSSAKCRFRKYGSAQARRYAALFLGELPDHGK